MVLRNSISNTKKFFQKTIQGFKSLLFSDAHYQKIPKTTDPPLAAIDMNTQTNYNELHKFYTDFTTTNNNQAKKKKILSKGLKSPPPKDVDHQVPDGSFLKFVKSTPNHRMQRRDQNQNHQYFKIMNVQEREDSSTSTGAAGEGRGCLMEEKLKELEMMDMSNVDHVLDIEEVLHYYSRLTCPAYRDIVDKFFTELYAEFFRPFSTTPVIGSRPKLRSVRS